MKSVNVDQYLPLRVLDKRAQGGVKFPAGEKEFEILFGQEDAHGWDLILKIAPDRNKAGTSADQNSENYLVQEQAEQVLIEIAEQI